MLGGKIVRGVHGSAGALGWLNLDWRAASDKNHGYLERYAAGSSLETIARQLDPQATSYELIGRARAGDSESEEIIQRVAYLWGIAYANIASVLDPEVLIFSGGLVDAFDLFAATLSEVLREMGSPSVRETPVLAAQLGSHAAAYGALRAAMLQDVLWL
jgi:glucokinase